MDSGNDQSQIKKAYMSLQKRCHPDIAGTAGHEMAIILNEAYDVLSDLASRHAYDKEQAKLTELRGFTGRPVYSVWQGSKTEQRAIFVDENRCLGCLKCALLAEKTFAIETAYGRARVVSQWADPEDKIQAAINACPVSCIWTIERSDLAALEYLMSKQPQGKVIGMSKTSDFSELERDVRISAIQIIRSIPNWLYWESPDSYSTKNLAPRKNNKSRDPVSDPIIDRAPRCSSSKETKRWYK